MVKELWSFWYRINKRVEKGATIAEYALVLALVSLALIGVLTTLGETLVSKIFEIVNKLQGIQ